MLSVSPASGLASGGAPGGPFSPASQTYGLTNTGTATLNWTATKTAAWLTLSSTSGTPEPGRGSSGYGLRQRHRQQPVRRQLLGHHLLRQPSNGTGNTTRSASLSITSFGFYDDFSTFASGNLVGQGSWVQYSTPSGAPLQVSGGKVTIPGGQTTDTQDAYKNFTQTNITLFYGLTLTVTSAVNSTSASYFTALYTSNNAVGYANFRLTAKAGDVSPDQFRPRRPRHRPVRRPLYLWHSDPQHRGPIPRHCSGPVRLRQRRASMSTRPAPTLPRRRCMRTTPSAPARRRRRWVRS